ncbi:MAG: sulfite exporter TauE/SafE family protein [Deltaproteobacteria bacterium]
MIEYGLAFISGILGSFHCIGMCGGFPVLVSNIKDSDRFEKTLRQLLYNSGRIFTYFFLGAMAGFLGFMIKEMKPVFSIQTTVSVVTGLIIIFIGLQITGLFKERHIPGFTPIYEVIRRMMSSFLKRKGRLAPFLLGMVNGFLPCPLIYGFLLVSLSQYTPVKGGLMMLFLGLGTIPAMFLIAVVYQKVSPVIKFNLSRLIPGFLMTMFGIITIARAMIPFGFGERIQNICGFL